MTLRHYHVNTGEFSMTWIGGPAIHDGDHVWLTRPEGERVLRVHRQHVTASTPEETVQRLIDDRNARLGRN